MDSKKFTKQILAFNKAVFDNSYYGMTILQSQSYNFTDGFLRQFPWVTAESKKPIMQSWDYLKTAGENYKSAVDQGFERVESMIDGERA